MRNSLNIFISYRRTDKDFAGRVHDNLKDNFEVFFDKEGGINSGANFPKAIEDGIKNSDVVLMIIGQSCCQEFQKKANQIDFVVEEIALAKKVGCTIIPILMEGVEFPFCFPKRLEFVSNINAFEFGRNSFSIYRLKESNEPLFLFITDIEDGDEKLDKQFATILRNFKTKYPHFHAVFVGRKELAKLVYGEGSLSPLNTAKELFFPDDGIKLGEQRLTQQFQTFGKQREQVCKLLQKPSLGRFSAWSYNQTINQLFWKNLLVRKGNRFVWRGEITKAIAKEVLGCDEDMI